MEAFKEFLRKCEHEDISNEKIKKKQTEGKKKWNKNKWIYTKTYVDVDGE